MSLLAYAYRDGNEQAVLDGLCAQDRAHVLAGEGEAAFGRDLDGLIQRFDVDLKIEREVEQGYVVSFSTFPRPDGPPEVREVLFRFEGNRWCMSPSAAVPTT